MVKRILTTLITIMIFAALFTMSLSWNFLELDRIIQSELNSLPSHGIPLKLNFKKSYLRIIPLELKVENVRVTPLDDLASQVNSFEIESVTVSPSIWHIFFSQIRIASIKIQKTNLVLNIKEKNESKDIDLDIFKILSRIPIDKLELNTISLKIQTTYNSKNIQSNISGLSATIINDKDFLNVKLKIADLYSKIADTEVFKRCFLETRFILTKKNLVLTDLKIKESTSFIVATGTTQLNLKNKSFGKGNINFRTETDSEKIRFLYKLITKKDVTPIDKLQTMIRGDIRIAIDKKIENSVISAETAFYNFQYDKFRVGNLLTKVKYSGVEKKFNIEEARLTNGGITAFSKDININLDTLTFKSVDLKVKMFKLKDYLQYSLNNQITSNVDVDGDMQCDGALDPLKINCIGNVNAKNIKVNSGTNEFIINIPIANATGSLSLNDKELNYDANITAMSSKGKSTGVINYNTGFLIQYSSPEIHLSEIKNISKLQLNGIAKASGSTKGNSKTATFDIQLETQDFILNKYKLGNVSTLMSYQNGLIHLSKIQGSTQSTRYLGDLNINLTTDSLHGKLQFPFIDLAVTQDSIKEHLNIPFALAGSGSAIVNIESPLDIKKLSLNAKARLYNCKLDQQHADNIDIDIVSENGIIKLNSIIVEEKSSNLRFGGSINIKNEEFDISFTSKRILTDDIVYTSSLLKKINGNLKVDGTITKTFLAPTLQMTFNSDEFFYAKQSLAPLKGKLFFEKSNSNFDISAGDLFNLKFLNSTKMPSYQIEGQTNNFDLSPAIATFLDSNAIDSFKLIQSAKFNLKIPKDKIENLSGYAQFSNFVISSNSNTIKLDKPASLFFTNGKLNFSSFDLKGSGGQLLISSTPNSTDPMDIRVAGIFSLSLLHIFTPFLETIEGQTTANFKLKYSNNKFQIIGSSYIEDGYIKLPEIQHAVESVKADILFNQDKIILNSISGKFASGTLLGDGSITLSGPRNLPLLLNIHLDDIRLNLPSDVVTSGNASLKLLGNWLPFTLTGNYDIYDGTITKQFGSKSETNLDSPYHIFLPQVLRKKESSAILLDVNTNIKNPLRIKNSFVDGKMIGNLKIVGLPQKPSLGGKIELTKNSLINFKDAQFRVRDSNIQFKGDSPPNPDLYLLANTDYRGYAIEMQVLGNAEKPKFKFTSQPTLSDQEIVSLLTLGYTSDASLQTSPANLNPAQLNNQTSIEVGTDLFSQNPLGKEFKDRFGFDVQFSSNFDTANSVASPKISVGKKLSEKMTISGSALTGKDRRYDAKIRYQLNKDIYGTANITSQGAEEANQNFGNRPSDVLGIDLEYRKEFK